MATVHAVFSGGKSYSQKPAESQSAREDLIDVLMIPLNCHSECSVNR